jgi:transposase-like protein
MSTMKSKRRREGAEHDEPPREVMDRLAELLPEGALDDAVRGLKPEELSGPGGLLSQLAGRVVEAALEAEMTEHLGHPPGGVPQRANVRNGATAKTLQTDLGPVEINTPRDRQGSFEPQLVAKRQTRLAGLDDKILGLYAGGMTVRDISHHLSELYGTEIGRDTISRITDAVLEDVQAWRTRPLEAVYPIVYFDALRVKVRVDRSVKNLACYLALGVDCDGEREVLGIWWQETEGAKFWLAVLNDLHRRGVSDVLIACVDGLKGFPEAIEAVFPQTWVQTCIVHLIRASLRYVNYRDLKKVASALRPIGRLHDQHHRGPAPPDPQGHQDPRSVPGPAGRHQADLLGDHQGRRQVATQPNLERATRSPEDPLRRPLPRLTTTTTTKPGRHDSHTVRRTPSRYEFGYVFQIAEPTPHTRRGARGLTLPPASQIDSPNESELLPTTAQELQRLGLRPREIALDGGFPTTAANQQFPAADVFIAGRQHPPSRRSKKRLASYRAGCEGRISHLKRSYGLRRSRLRGHDGARTWTGWAILTYNLDSLAVQAP